MSVSRIIGESVRVALLAALVGLAGTASAQETRVTVRVLAQGAKFIGGDVAGAHVRIADTLSGEVLAHGYTRGGTGDTQQIMGARDRFEVRATEAAAGFTTALDLQRATRVTVTVRGPLNQLQAAVEATKEFWLLPGVDLTAGDGLLFELPGLAVDLLAPAAHGRHRVGEAIALDATVAMLCGCSLASGGLWDADTVAAEAFVYNGGEVVERIELAFTGEINRFAASYTPAAPGTHEIELRVFHGQTRSTGVDRAAIFVSP